MANRRVLNPPVEHAKKRREKLCKPAPAGVVGRQLCHLHRCHTTYANYKNPQGQVLIVCPKGALHYELFASPVVYRLSLREFS